uniref:NPH3 domain-containing protein n=1 Tax=Kalanchoe fedtschenkoi TaxID=63787 RepID=A0A7N0UH90_KALFE
MPGDWQTFELVARFCHGYDPTVTSGNAIPLFCLAHYLGMTDAHSQGNLLPKVSAFIRDKILPSWNESVKAFRTSEAVIKMAADLGLVDACMESIVSKAVTDPRLLGEPMESGANDEDEEEEEEEEDGKEGEIRYAQPAVRRRLFDQDWQLEDLTMLSLQLYEPIMLGMIHNKVPSRYIASSLCEYAKKWVLPYVSSGQNASRIHAKEVIEAVERMLPNERGLIPCTVLFQMLRFALLLDAGSVCRSGLEQRIGQQLDLATVEDLLIPSQGYAKEVQYDVECVKRMLKIFYSGFADASDQPGPMSGLMRVAAMMEEFLAQVASDIDLKLDTFTQLAEFSAAASSGSHRCSDGIYRAIDIYLDKHRYLTEAERDKACQVLDCHTMSAEAVEHAAQNERLPLRVVVQAVFADQLKLRSVIAREVNGVRGSQGAESEHLGVVKAEEAAAGSSEIVKMESKMMELEMECSMIRKEIETEIGRGRQQQQKKKKEKSGGGGMWREMKRKFGCMSSNSSSVNVHDGNCHVIKKKKEGKTRIQSI